MGVTEGGSRFSWSYLLAGNIYEEHLDVNCQSSLW